MSNPSIVPPDERGYALSDVFVTTEWLAENISNPNVRVVDTDVPEEYQKGHIPGSVNPVDHYYKKSLDERTHIQGPEQFAQTMSDLGIGDDTLVIGYNREGGVYSFRLMWALHYYGHTNVKVLDGGLEKWEAEGREVATTESSAKGSAGSIEDYRRAGVAPAGHRARDTALRPPLLAPCSARSSRREDRPASHPFAGAGAEPLRHILASRRH